MYHFIIVGIYYKKIKAIIAHLFKWTGKAKIEKQIWIP